MRRIGRASEMVSVEISKGYFEEISAENDSRNVNLVDGIVVDVNLIGSEEGKTKEPCEDESLFVKCSGGISGVY